MIANSARHSRNHLLRLRNRIERDEDCPLLEFSADARRDFQRQASLAHPAGSEQADQAVLRSMISDIERGNLRFTSDKGSRLRRQAGVTLLRRRGRHGRGAIGRSWAAGLLR